MPAMTKTTMTSSPAALSTSRLTLAWTLWSCLAPMVVLSQDSSSMCGPSGFSVAGSASVLPIAQAWRDAYMAECPNQEIIVEGGGSTEGAARICGNVNGNSTGLVEIGDMSRDWDVNEAMPRTEPYVYDCAAGDTARSVIQIDIALDGITVVATGGGSAASCIETLGGLTVDQLRWIFSDYSDAKLASTGWDPTSVANNDGDDSTRNWSELDASCDDVPIMIAGAADTSGTYQYFAETIFADFDNGETFDLNRNYTGNDDPDINIAIIESNPSAVAFLGYAYYYANGIELYAAAIQNDAGDYVIPGADSVTDGTYNPLSRRLFMNLLNDPDSLASTAPFVYFGFSPDGSDIVATTGYVPIPNPSEMLARLSEYSSVVDASAGTEGESAASSAASAWLGRGRLMMTSLVVVALGLAALM